jgi:putative oxidoreductase
MTYSSNAYGALLLRVALGTMFLTHAYLTVFAEAIGGILLILGVQTRWVALALTPILLGAVWVHAGNGWVFSAANGGWEYPLYLVVLAIAQALIGDGAYALSPSRSLSAASEQARAGIA